MTDVSNPTTATPPEGLGVVSPLGGTLPAALGGRWQRLPLLGRAFVFLALLDVVARAFGLVGERLAIDATAPFTIVTAFLPHDALILLPAVVVARRADAARATPLVVRGAIVVALVELLRGPLTAMPFGAERGDPMLAWTIASTLATALAASGWVLVAMGLAALTPAPSRPSVAGFANLAAGTLLAGAGAWLLEVLIGASLIDVGDPGWNSMILLTSAVAPLQLVAWAFVARVAVQGLGDLRRPPTSTTLAATAMVLAAVSAALIVLELLLMAAQYFGVLGGSVIAGTLGLGWLGSGIVPTALVVAFGLGLADTSVRIPGDGAARAAPAQPDVEPVRWPAPGGEVPAFREPPPSPIGPSAGTRPRRTRKTKEPHA